MRCAFALLTLLALAAASARAQDTAGWVESSEPTVPAVGSEDSTHPIAGTARVQDAGVEFFEQKIRPVLVEKCYECHSHQAKKHRGDLYLDSRDGMRKGGENGPAV